jgi:hypothetical protein
MVPEFFFAQTSNAGKAHSSVVRSLRVRPNETRQNSSRLRAPLLLGDRKMTHRKRITEQCLRGLKNNFTIHFPLPANGGL